MVAIWKKKKKIGIRIKTAPSQKWHFYTIYVSTFFFSGEAQGEGNGRLPLWIFPLSLWNRKDKNSTLPKTAFLRGSPIKFFSGEAQAEGRGTLPLWSSPSLCPLSPWSRKLSQIVPYLRSRGKGNARPLEPSNPEVIPPRVARKAAEGEWTGMNGRTSLLVPTAGARRLVRGYQVQMLTTHLL